MLTFSQESCKEYKLLIVEMVFLLYLPNISRQGEARERWGPAKVGRAEVWVEQALIKDRWSQQGERPDASLWAHRRLNRAE